jgi:hypothetical protein
MGTIAKNRYWIDLKLFDSKVSIVTDYFTDTRKDLLIRDSVSGIVGSYAPGALPTANAGTVKNSGVEFSIDYKDNLSDDSVSVSDKCYF